MSKAAETKNVRVKKSIPKKTKFLSITRLSAKFALTIPKTKLALVSKGFMDEHGQLTDKARELEAGKVSKTEDRFNNSGEVEYILWDYLVLESHFDKPSEIDLFCTFRRKGQVRPQFCALFQRASKFLEAPHNLMQPTRELKNWKKKHKLSDETVQAMMECQFSDLHFIGGNFVFDLMDQPGDVDVAWARGEKTFREIHVALLKVSTDEAALFETVLNRMKTWLKKVVSKHH